MTDSENMILVGVDGGGTGCRAAVGTLADGVLAQAGRGRANAASDPELAIKNVLMAVNAAAEEAGIPPQALGTANAHLGLAGVMTAQDSQRIASAMPFAKSVVTDDRPTTVTGALGGQDGYVLSVGTGTIVAASKSGTLKYVGGWGFHVADQASGAWLGRSALERVLLCHDGITRHSGLTRSIFAKFDNDPNAIVAFSMAASPGDYAAFAPDVVSAARDGDPWGKAFMSSGADYLAQSLAVLGFRGGDTICLTGGVGPHYASYLPSEYLAAQITSRGTALDGAFQLAKLIRTTMPEATQ